MTPLRTAAAGLLVAAHAAAPAAAQTADDYSDPDYRASDASDWDTMTRSLGRQRIQATSPAYHQALLGAALVARRVERT
jgi:hypothetical protein